MTFHLSITFRSPVIFLVRLLFFHLRYARHYIYIFVPTCLWICGNVLKSSLLFSNQVWDNGSLNCLHLHKAQTNNQKSVKYGCARSVVFICAEIRIGVPSSNSIRSLYVLFRTNTIGKIWIHLIFPSSGLD